MKKPTYKQVLALAKSRRLAIQAAVLKHPRAKVAEMFGIAQARSSQIMSGK